MLKEILEEHRRGHRGETSVSLAGTVSDPTAKKTLSEQMKSGLTALDSTQFLDRESGKIVLSAKPNKTKNVKTLTADEKLVDDFHKLTKKRHS